MVNRRRQATARRSLPRWSEAHLDGLIGEAIVDCYNTDEQLTGLFTMIEENLALPFETEVLGVPVTVERIELSDADQIIAVCRRGRTRQTICLVDLPLPSPLPNGSEWIEAYRHWSRRS